MNNTTFPKVQAARRNGRLWLIVVLAWSVVIFILSTRAFGLVWSNNVLWKMLTHLGLSVSNRTLLDISLFIRKLAHVGEYAVLAALLYRLVRVDAEKGWHPRSAFISVLLGALYAASDELHQFFVPGRQASVYDWLLDVSGVGLGMSATYVLIRLFAGKKQREAASSESTAAK